MCCSIKDNHIKNKKMTNLRVATVSDFKVGTILITSEGWEFRIMRKYDEGVWEARGVSGDKVVFENEARHYKVAK